MRDSHEHATSRPRGPSCADGLAHRSCCCSTPTAAVTCGSSALLGCSPGSCCWSALARDVHAAGARADRVVVVLRDGRRVHLSRPLLEVYLYRFHNVPMYVPPGHGLVYLAALRARARAVGPAAPTACTVAGAGVAVGGWAAYGCCSRPGHDVLGAFWFVCLVGVPAVGAVARRCTSAPPSWSPGSRSSAPASAPGRGRRTTRPLGVAIGNPPSGAAGGYGWFDLAALLLAPYAARWSSRVGLVGVARSGAGRRRALEVVHRRRCAAPWLRSPVVVGASEPRNAERLRRAAAPLVASALPPCGPVVAVERR